MTVASPLPTVKLYELRRDAVSNGVGLQLIRQLKNSMIKAACWLINSLCHSTHEKQSIRRAFWCSGVRLCAFSTQDRVSEGSAGVLLKSWGSPGASSGG